MFKNNIDKYSCDCNSINQEEVEKARNGMIKDEVFYKTFCFFKSISDNTRLRILVYLKDHELCVCDLAVLLNMTKSSISHQLKILKENGIVKNRRNGKNIYYTLQDEHVKDIIEQSIVHMMHN